MCFQEGKFPKLNNQTKTNVNTFGQRVTKHAVCCQPCWDARRGQSVCSAVPIDLVNPGAVPGVRRQYVSNMYLLIKTNACAGCQYCILKTVDFLLLGLPSTILFHTLEQKNSYACVFFKSAQLRIPQSSFSPSLSWTFTIRYTAKLPFLQYLF